MKKFIIGMTGIALCVCLTACGTSNTTSSISSLSNQLDSTANAVSSVSTISPSDIGISNESKNEDIYNNSQMTQRSLLNEQYYKTEILDKTAKIKNQLSDITLSKMQKSAIKDLTSTLNKYTSSVTNTKHEMNSSAKAISSMKKNVSKNEDKLYAKYNRLACNSNIRSAYYENILNTLDEIERCLNLDCENCAPQDQEQQNNTSEETSDQKQTKSLLTKNIDTYNNNTTDEDSTDENTTQTPEPRKNRNNYANNPYSYNRNYNRLNRFNSSRNTDTYGPNYRNIDTYGGNRYNGYNGYNGFNGYRNGFAPYGNNGYGYGNNGFGYGNNYYAGSNNGNRLTAPVPMPPATFANAEQEPEKRLETYEKVNPDNTVEKIETENAKSENVKEDIKDIANDTLDKAKDKITETSKFETLEKTKNEVSQLKDNTKTNDSQENDSTTSATIQTLSKPKKMHDTPKQEIEQDQRVVAH